MFSDISSVMEARPSDPRNQRSTCSSRGSLPVQSWAWCILIQCWIAVPAVRSSCRGVNISVSVYPVSSTIRYGDPLEIFCTTEGSTSDIEFRLDGVELESEKINETTRRLYIKNPKKQMSVYLCRNKKTRRTCVSRVAVDSPPADVTNFSCISKNLEVLNCSWTCPDSFIYNNYSLTYTIHGIAAYPYCRGQTTRLNNIMYCVWDASQAPRYRATEETIYFLMTICNVLGCNYQNFTVDHYSIVKPDPPTNLKVIKIEPHSVILRWSIPNNMYDLLGCGVKHVIEYQISKIDNGTYFHRVDSSSLPPKNRTYQFKLKLPYAYMQYEIRIYIETIKAVKREFRSDFSYIFINTASKRPERPPEMISGAFDQAIWDGKRIIYVYWKQIEEYTESGDSFTYKVLYTQGNKTYPIVFPNRKKSLSYVAITNVSMEALNVYVWSSNTNGSSPTSSYLYIPPKQERHALSLTSFTKLAHENGTYQLFWDGVENIDNYTLFWCHYDISHICLGRIDFAVIDARKTSHIIDLPKEYKYQFAISANKDASSTGMVWATCDISKDGFAMYRVPARLRYDAPGKSSVRLSWWLDCALQNGIITGYNITYCPILPTSAYCDKTVENKNIHLSNPKQRDVVIENLNPFTTYQCSLSINTIYGQKYIEDAVAVFTTTEDTPTSPINIKISDMK